MLNFRNTHHGRGVHEEDSLNQAASNRSGTISVPVGPPRETNRSVQFGVPPKVRTIVGLGVRELTAQLSLESRPNQRHRARHGRFARRCIRRGGE